MVKYMKKDYSLIIVITMLILISTPASVQAKAPVIGARAAVLLDLDTGKVLFEQNAHKQLPPASTTKVLTTILALEKGRLNKIINISSNASSIGESSLGLSTGDKLTLQDLIHGALIKSANDACVAIAEEVAPSEEEYLGLMNLKARTLGAENTDFRNTNGLPQDGHLTTAYDLSIITRYALRNKTFADIVRKKYYTVAWLDNVRTRQIKNTNLLLWTYSKTIGVKTGTTNKAGKCLIAAAREGDTGLVAVILNSPDRFNEARRLLEYGFKMKERVYAKQ